MWRYAVLPFVLMLMLGVAAGQGLLEPIDHAVANAFSLRAGDTGVEFWYWVSWSGGGKQRYIIVGVISLALGLWLHWRTGLALALTALASNLTSDLLKALFGRARPDLTPHLDPISSMAFPSGHAASAMMVYLMVALIVPTNRRWLWIAGAVVLAFLTGWSRIMLGVHWFTDLLGGWMLGATFALVGLELVRRYGGKPIDAAPHNG